MKTKLNYLSVLGISVIFAGCASVEMDSGDADALSKSFNPPENGKSGIYIYRDEFLGCALKKTLWIDGEYLGDTAAYTYFYMEIEPGKHVISSESGFGESHIGLNLKPNENTFVQQEMKMGFGTSFTKLNLKSEENGKKDILNSCQKAQNMYKQPGKDRLNYFPSKFDELYDANFADKPNDSEFTTEEKMGISAQNR